MTGEVSLKTSLLVSAEIRRCDSLFLNAVIVHRGDDERGVILIRKYVSMNYSRIFMQERNEDGELRWHQPLGDTWIDDEKANNYISRQRKYDEDLWVLEIDDPKNEYEPGI